METIGSSEPSRGMYEVTRRHNPIIIYTLIKHKTEGRFTIVHKYQPRHTTVKRVCVDKSHKYTADGFFK
jgi:hypothetical protein